MANFAQTNIPKFSPYIPEIPVEAYTKVGMFKQQQYEQGIQKIQQSIDTIAGLPVDGKFSPYVQDKLSNLQKTISTIPSGDYSNEQLVNHITNTAAAITKDPIVRNAILSTAALQQAQTDAEKAKTTAGGKYWSPSNEYALQKQIQSWRDNGDLTTQFTGSYQPYSDYNAHALKAIQALNPTITDLPFQRNTDGSLKLDANGNPMIDQVMLTKTGLTQQQVQNALGSALSEADKNQISIDGQYAFRNLDKEGMAKMLSANTNEKLADIDTQVNHLTNVDKVLNPNDTAYQNKIQEEIDGLNSQADTLKKNLNKSVSEIGTNLDAFKGSYYLNNYIDQFTKAYSSQSYQYKNNPYMAMQYKRAQYELNMGKLQTKKGKADTSNGTISLYPGGLPGETMPTTPPSQTISEYNSDVTNGQKLLDTNVAAVAKDNNMTPQQVYDIMDKYTDGNNLSPTLKSDINTLMEEKRMQDRKVTTFNIVSKEADANFNPQINKLLSGIPSITLGGVTYSPQDLAKYNSDVIEQKNAFNKTHSYSSRQNVSFPEGAIGTSISGESFQFKPTSTKEAQLHSILSQQSINSPGNKILNEIGTGLVKIEGDRTAFVAGELVNRTRVGQISTFGIDNSNSKLKDQIATSLNEIIDNANTEGKNLANSTDGRHYNFKEASAMVQDKNNTIYNLEKKGYTDDYYIVLTNDKIGERNYIPISGSRLSEISPDLVKKPSVVDNIRRAISQGGGSTTNLTGNPRDGYFGRNYFPSLNNQEGTNFSATADIKKAKLSDNYSVILHLHDAANPDIGWKDYTLNTKIPISDKDLDSVPQLLSNISPNQIEQILYSK